MPQNIQVNASIVEGPSPNELKKFSQIKIVPELDSLDDSINMVSLCNLKCWSFERVVYFQVEKIELESIQGPALEANELIAKNLFIHENLKVATKHKVLRLH